MFSERKLSGLKYLFGTVSTFFILAAFLLPAEVTARSAALEKVIEGAKKEGVLMLLWTEGHFGADVRGPSTMDKAGYSTHASAFP